MKRSTRVVLPALLAFAAVVQPAGALPGPDPDDAPPEFSIVIAGTHDGETEVFEELLFARAAGWDFGDREAYRCGFVEYVADGQVQFELVFERLEVPGHGANYIIINDRHGLESGEGGSPPAAQDNCGLPAGGGALAHDGTPLLPGGANLTIYKDTLPYLTYALPAVSPINYESFWSAGDEPGEAYLWYIEEGEANDAVVRFTIRPVAPGVALTPEPPPILNHASIVGIELRGHLRAIGDVETIDGTEGCESDRIVAIQRRIHGTWRNVGRDEASADGRYLAQIRDKEGVFRAVVRELALETGDICDRAVSRKWRHDHSG